MSYGGRDQSHRGWVLATAIVLTLGMSACSSSPSGSPSSSGSSAVNSQDGKTTARPGHKNDGGSIADGAPLVVKTNPKPVTYQGAPVIQADNLLSLDDLSKLGIYYAANIAANTYERWYFAGSGTGALQIDHGFFDSDNPFNSVSYVFEANGTPEATDYLQLSVFQPAYADFSDFTGNLSVDSYQAAPGIGDVEVYQEPAGQTKPGSTIIGDLLHHGNTAVTLSGVLSGTGYLPKLNDILKTVAANLDAQTAQPTGPSTITYNSPVFPASVLQPCPLLSPNMFTTAYRQQPAPFLTESIGTGIGAIQFTDSPQTFNYAKMDCTMNSGADTNESRKHLQLEIRSYLDVAGANEDMKYNRQTLGGENPDKPVGDDSYVTTINAGGVAPGSFVFRKGRFVLQLTGPSTGATVLQANQAFTPVAQEILRKIGSQN